MKRFFRSKRLKVFAAIIVVLLVCVVIACVSANSSSPVNSAFGAVFSPVQSLVSSVSDRFSDIVVGGSASAYEEEISSLRNQLADYEARLVDYDEAVYKLASYEEMLELKEENPDYELAYANIIGTDSQDLFSSLIIDKGESDGISTGDPVVYGEYAVGIVSSVKPTYSVVHTLLDPSVSVGAYETKSREKGYITTTAELSRQGLYMLSGLQRETTVDVTGTVCTSGIGGVFPKGLLIGPVVDVRYSDVDISSCAIIQPSISISDLQDVFVITSFKGQGIEEIEDAQKDANVG